MTIQTILLAADLEPESRPAIDYAFALGEKVGAVVHVVHALTVSLVPESPSPGSVPTDLIREQEARDRLTAALAHHAASASMGTCIISLGEPVSVIGETAEAVSADAIVVGTHERAVMHRLIVGSVAEGVVHESRCPVLVIKTKRAKRT